MTDACCGPEEVHGEGEADQAVMTPVWQVRQIQAAAVSGVFLLAGLIAPAGSIPELVLFAVSALVGGATFVPVALRGLLRARLGVGLLMTIAAAGAVLLGQVAEAATLAFLFSIAEGLEHYAVTRTRNSLRALLALAPSTATVDRGAGYVTVELKDLIVGDVLLVRPGEKLATDGVVRQGRSSIDTSVVTGESMPVEVDPGSKVFAGTVNGTGALEVAVTATAADNSLARLVHVVQEAQDRKGASQRLAERAARPLVPGVLVLAVLVGVIGSLLGDPLVWIPRALVVLVAAAPCAFALSVPIAVVAAVGAASKGGVLIKGGAAVEALGSVRTVALDKTGTLTRNEPQVIEVVTTSAGGNADQVLAVAAALEARSEHPLAAAILTASRNLGPLEAGEVAAFPGRGLIGQVAGKPAGLGKAGFIDPAGLEPAVARLQDVGATVVVVEHDGAVLGVIAVRDEIRPEAREAVDMLRRQGVETVMLTGDNSRTAAAIAAEAGISEVRAELSPEDKASIVVSLQSRTRVAMVGDGINDAPALASADAGVAMGAMGSDVAIETADVALMGEDLRRLPDAIAHARRARAIFTQNLVLSGLIIVILVPLAAFGILSLTTVVATHELAEVLVILNGIRAGRRHLLPTRAVLPGSAAPDTTSQPAAATTDIGVAATGVAATGVAATGVAVPEVTVRDVAAIEAAMSSSPGRRNVVAGAEILTLAPATSVPSLTLGRSGAPVPSGLGQGHGESGGCGCSSGCSCCS